jgi:hypothetical protein
MTVIDKTNKEVAFIGLAIPLTHNVQATNIEKQRKCQDLAFEIKQQWQLNKIIVIPMVLSVKGLIPIMLNQSLTTLNLLALLLSQVQEVVVLSTCSSVRKFLSNEVHLSDEEAYHVSLYIHFNIL